MKKFKNSLIISWESQGVYYAKYGYRGMRASSKISKQRAITNLKNKLTKRYS